VSAGGVVVRRARAADDRPLAALHLRSALTAYAEIFPPDAPKPTAASLARHWAEAIADPTSAVFVAELDDSSAIGGVIATTVTPPGVGNVRHLYVDPLHWGRGAGRMLHDAAVSWCVERGVGSPSLWVLEANDRARQMYERWGWAVLGGELFVNAGSGVREVCYRLDRVTGP